MGCVDEFADSALDEYDPGAIKRVRMKNFVTYSDIEYFLGNSLNMIIGPNGTGKSTFVSALCLGLMGKPDVLGRAKTVNEYIKNGEKEAVIEIELQGLRGKASPVIKRVINSEKGTSWFINNTGVTQKEVAKAIQKYNIQVDNLCQFLPQDKVASFAQSTPENLLLSTERAIGPDNMVEQHMELSRLSQTLAELSGNVSTEAEKLEKLEEEHKAQEEQINSIRDLEQQKQKKTLLEHTLPYAEYEALKNKYRGLKSQEEELQKEYDEAQEKNRPFLDMESESRKRAELCRRKAQEADKDLQTSQNKVEQKLREVENQQDQLDETQSRYNTIGRSEKNYDREIKGLREKRDRCREKLEKSEETPVEEEKIQSLTNELEQIKMQVREIQAQKDNAQSKRTDADSLYRKAEAERQNVERKLQQVDSVLNKKIGRLEQVGRDCNCRDLAEKTGNVLRILEKYKDNFKKEVLEPPVLSVKVKDKDLLKHLDSGINWWSMWTFTCQTDEDYAMFGKLILDQHQINVRANVYAGSGKVKPADHPRPLSSQQLREYGFDGYLIDGMEGPEGVLNMLCHEDYIHSTPFCKGDAPPGLESRLRRPDPSGKLLIRKYVDQRYVVNISRSKYGNRSINTSSEPANPYMPKHFNVGVEFSNATELQTLNEKLSRLVQEVKKAHQQVQVCGEEVKGYEEQLEALRPRFQEAKKEKIQLEEHKRSIMSIRQKLKAYEDDLQKKEADRPDFQADKLQLKQTVDSLTKSLVNPMASIHKILQTQVLQEQEIFRQRLEQKTRESEAQEFKRLAKEGLEELVQKRNEIKAQMTDLAHEIRSLKEKVREIPEQYYEPVKQRALESSVEDIKVELENVNASIELSSTHVGDYQRTMERFNRRAETIEVLRKRVNENKSEVTSLEEKIEEIRSVWEPCLDQLITDVSHRFKNAFNSIGCNGEVRLRKSQQYYSQWAIEIMVSFRENMPLQQLTGQRQSGGERAVSTVLYLMALQEFANSPFRVVDEINQGMDPVNERMVHNKMVDVACKASTSQYFLVTPKLLPDLHYARQMGVSCIFSGPMVADFRGVSLEAKTVANRMKQLLADD
jgi:chromosome segregation ATPase